MSVSRTVLLLPVVVAAAAPVVSAQPGGDPPPVVSPSPQPAPAQTAPTPATKKGKATVHVVDRAWIDVQIRRYDRLEIDEDKNGVAQGLPLGVASEAIQILGEIVVDRASAEAYRLIETRLASALSCGKERSPFSATCEVVKSIRIEDLASAPAALRSALLVDASRLVTTEVEKISFAGHYAVLLKEIVIPALARPGHFDTSLPASIVDHIVRYALDHRSDELCKKLSAASALMVAGAAVAACEAADLGTRCPVSAIIEELRCSGIGADPWRPVADRARSLAAKMLVALHSKQDGEIVLRARTRTAIEVMFDDLCAQADAHLGCAGPGPNAREVDVLRSIALGALDGDTNAIVAAIIRHLKARLDRTEDEKARLGRGLRIVAALLDYASTYMPDKGAFDKGEGAAEMAKAAHEKRKKILESLTAEMTNRTERGGDWIKSAGGSLRGVVGRRLRDDHDDPSWLPLQLTIGFAIDRVPPEGSTGFHFELGVLDLGQYLSFEEDDGVREPGFADALAPSATIALIWGRSLPFQLGVTGAYAPQYLYEDGKRGSWSIGGTAGIYVPLFDID